jgi:TetR/AcrR family transcriptional regulator
MSPRSKVQFQEMQNRAREKILDAGLKLFSAKGAAATGVTEIAKEAGVSLGLLYHYFSSKEDVFLTLLNMALEGAMEALRPCQPEKMSAADGIRKISRMASETLRRNEKTAQYFLLLLQAGLTRNSFSGIDKLMLEKAAMPFIFLEDLIRTGQGQGTVRTGDPRQLAQLYWAAFQGLCLYKVTMRDFFPPTQEQLNVILLK